MVLSDNEIKAALVSGQLVIDPRPGEDRIASTAVDLTLGGREMRRWSVSEEDRAHLKVDPSRKGFLGHIASKYLDDVPRERDGSVILSPHAFILAMTSEVVKLPRTSRLAARVEGKSSLARIGLAVHVTAPTIHAGWEGEITLEIVNLGPHDIILRPGMAICQLILEQVHGTPGGEAFSQFQGQQTVVG